MKTVCTNIKNAVAHCQPHFYFTFSIFNFQFNNHATVTVIVTLDVLFSASVTEYACVKDPENYFFLVVKGDSMEPRISDGDLALVHRQNTLDNGDLGVLVYGADGEGTLKKYIQRGNSVILHPFNPAYEELVIKGEELDHLYIAGKVVETKAKW